MKRIVFVFRALVERDIWKIDFNEWNCSFNKNSDGYVVNLYGIGTTKILTNTNDYQL